MKIFGTVVDTSNGGPLRGAIVMAVRLSDSTLLSYTRSAPDGSFDLPNTPIDTFQVIVQHPQFADQVFIVIGTEENKEFNFGKVILPPKTTEMGEVVIYGFKEPVYFKGDTIVYVADSFNVKQNANVEDLLKKLPGITVDKEGNIKSRGKEVAQVLVDGDEFFGSDPTMATKNLAAKSVESVEVYEKKNEDASASGSETVTVMDLKLKDDAKKGYFGKASVAGDFKKFYEGEFLSNNFSNKRKVSVFGLASNTPKSSFGFSDSYKYGIENENLTITEGEDGGNMVMYSGNGAPQGFPTTRKAGFYFNDKPTPKAKINANYSYKENLLRVTNSTHTQYFLADTNYVTDNNQVNTQSTKGHNIGLKYTQQLDSLTSLDIEPKVVMNNTAIGSETTNNFLTVDGTETRKTRTNNITNTKATDFSTKAVLTRKFHKADRVLSLRYNFDYSERSNTGKLYTLYNYSVPVLPDSIIDQQKTGSSHETVNRAVLSYTEPLSPKFKVNFLYDLTTGNANQKRETFNKLNQEYAAKDSLLSNEFDSYRINNLFATTLIYETKKIKFTIGAKVRNNNALNKNLVTGNDIKQNVNNLLPTLTYRYKFTDNKQINFNYTTDSKIPKIGQLQPVPDNSNPNFVKQGNPDLLPTYEHNFDVNYYVYSALRNSYIYSGLQVNLVNNDFSTATNFDQFGRTVSKPINVDGNLSANAYLGGRLSLKPSVLFLNFNTGVGSFRNVNYINEAKNETKTAFFSGDLGPTVKTENLETSLNVGGSLNSTSSTLNALSNKPYGSMYYEADFSYQFKKGITFETDARYTRNSRRSNGYNINYLIWNASLEKKFFKRENVLLGVEIYDMLNQNISTNRSVQGNTIIDSKTSIIGRYFLVRATYKFDSKKEKINDDEEWF